MFKRKLYLLLLGVIILSGCSTMVVSKAVLLSEDKIYTLPAGQEVNLLLDKKSISITFSEDMKVVSADFLVRQEVENNKSFFAKVKAEKNTTKAVGVTTGILGTLAGAFATMKKKKTSVKV